MTDNYARTTAVVKVKRLHPDAQLPEYATNGSACLDIHAYLDDESTEVAMFGKLTMRTGLAFEVPAGHVMMVYGRSGHGARGIRLANCVGVIDSDYRGELIITLRNDTVDALHIHHGDRIAQAMIIPIPHVSLVEVEELSRTERGSGGFGSTGS